MKAPAARSLYIVLLNLHPREFRYGFGSEMLQIFDEAGEAYGYRWLLVDASASLLRQRFLRWPDDERQLVTPAEQSLLAGTYPMLRSPHLTARKLSMAFLLSLLSLMLIGPK